MLHFLWQYVADDKVEIFKDKVEIIKDIAKSTVSFKETKSHLTANYWLNFIY